MGDQRTRNVQVGNPPDFVCIGSQRSGTTWLYKNLSFHPQIWLIPVKELHYFDIDIMPYRKKIYRYTKHLRGRLRKMARQVITFDKELLRDLQWNAHYFLRKRNNKWYSTLFRPKYGQIAGEITPAYATVDIEKIKELKAINPDVKLIYILRDPIERGWSAAGKDLAKWQRRMLSEVPDKEIYSKLNQSGLTKRSNYLEVMEKWESVFKPEQFFIDFFENVVEEPKELLLRLHRFLGITATEDFISPKVQEKVNPTGKYKTPIPQRFQVHLADQQISLLKPLSKRLGGHSISWLKRAERILADQKQ